MELKFYKCMNCGNIITYMENKGIPVMCCGNQMAQLVPGAVDAAQEKHVPVVAVNGGKVTVTIGSVEHPMVEEHYIQWIALETKEGAQVKYLEPGAKPEAVFALSETDEAVAAYEYCNLHGLWKADI